MSTTADPGVVIREASDDDIEAVREVFLAVYSIDYPYDQFFDRTWLRRSVYTDDILMLVAEDTASGAIVGSASVVLDIGAHSDLIGEMGRLVVHPDARGRGIGRQLMAERVARIAHRLHVGIVENRCVHPFSQRVSRAHGFAPVGFLPMKHPFQGRESVALWARHFGSAAALRRNHPRVIPEAAGIAHLALEHCGFPTDAIVDDDARSYPPSPPDRYATRELTAQGYPSLLRIERGRLRGREIFGPMRLQYGFFKLEARHATYLVARNPGPEAQAGPLAGAVGFIHDDHEQTVRIFELIALEDEAVRHLLGALLERCREWGVAYIEVDVSAHAPRMQRTLLELGFLPVAFVPSMVFHHVERLDVVKMVRLLVPLDFGPLELIEGSRLFAERVIRSLTARHVPPRVAEAVRDLRLFAGLDTDQAMRVAGACALETFAPGEQLFAAGSEADRIHLVLSGHADIVVPGRAQAVGSVGPGESVGERALLTRQAHTAHAVARTPVEAAALSRADLTEIERLRPDIGLIIYRNLAAGLGRKLARANPKA